jgi:CO/xanthine dehydrogenase FAD-binding subunit
MNDIENYEVPSTIEEAAEILGRGPVTVLAGGTDLMVQSELGRIQFAPTLMNIRRIDALRGIEGKGDSVRIGALTTITELLEDELIGRDFPILRQAADVFASPQIRNAGTIGGNIGNASPAGDTLVPLLVLDAEVELASKPNGSMETRRVAIRDFFAGPGKTHRLDSELLVGVWVPKPPKGFVSRFEKFGTRPALDISTVSVGIGGVLADGALSDVRVAFGAVAPTPVRVPAVEEAVEGRPLDGATLDAAAAAAKAAVKPIDDVRATAWYRAELIHNLTRKVLRHVAGA